MKYTDNCIVFDGQVAQIYDETRPFMPPNSYEENLHTLCFTLSKCVAPGHSTIRLVDLGCGTGRIAIPLALQYARLHKKSPSILPTLHITAVDLSQDMLQVLEDKWASIQHECEGSVQLNTKKEDIRSLGLHGPEYDAAIAHWIFHTIDDWRVAAYAADQVLHPHARLFLLTEDSPLYSAIDGYITPETKSDPVIHKFWQEFFSERARFETESLRRRLGTFVIDNRIAALFDVLGWRPGQENLSLRWTTQKSIQWLIDKIIETRSFTNMQLQLDEKKAESAYKEIASRLRETFKDQLNYEWQFDTEMQIHVYKRPHNNYQSPLKGTILIDVARATVGRKWERNLERKRSAVPLWGRLIKSTWAKLNRAATTPLGGVTLGKHMAGSSAKYPSLIYMSAPEATGLSPFLRTIALPSVPPIVRLHADRLWSELTSALERCDPFVICRNMSSADIGRIRKMWNEQSEVHPPLHILELGNEVQAVEEAVRPLLEDDHFEEKVSERLEGLIRRASCCNELLEDASKKGIIPYNFSKAGALFLAGIGRLIVGNINCTYVFPAVPALPEGSPKPALGFLICVDAGLDGSTSKLIWSLGDILFGEYDDQMAVESSAAQKIEDLSFQETLIVESDPSESAPKTIGTAAGSEQTINLSSPAVGITTTATVKEDEEKLLNEVRKLLSTLHEVDLKRYVVVGKYLRYGESSLDELREAKRKIVVSCEKPSRSRENYLLWGHSGQGKTSFVKEIARTSGTTYIEVNLKDKDNTEASVRKMLQPALETTKPYLCLIDEADTPFSESWPDELIFEFLDWNTKKKDLLGEASGNIVFVLVGSTLPDLDAMIEKIKTRSEKGDDIINRIPIPNRIEVPGFTIGDKLILILTKLKALGAEMDKQIISVDKLALLYLLIDSRFNNGHQIVDTVRRALERAPAKAEKLSYGDLFENKDENIRQEFRRQYRQEMGSFIDEQLYIN